MEKRSEWEQLRARDLVFCLMLDNRSTFLLKVILEIEWILDCRNKAFQKVGQTRQNDRLVFDSSKLAANVTPFRPILAYKTDIQFEATGSSIEACNDLWALRIFSESILDDEQLVSECDTTKGQHRVIGLAIFMTQKTDGVRFDCWEVAGFGRGIVMKGRASGSLKTRLSLFAITFHLHVFR